MGYCVYHLEKGNISSGGIGNHIDRIAGKEHSYLHADPSKKDLNVHFGIYQKRNEIPLHKAISERISEGYKTKKAIRKDAVKYCTHVLTGSHEEMKTIFSDKKKANEWIQANYDFLKNEYGKTNIVRFTLHLDEKTPHLHAVTIPLTKDGRLSAKEIIGNKSVMQERQDRYAEVMKPFNLERGLRNTGITHENAQEYYKRISEAQKQAVLNDLKAQKNTLGVYTTESVQNLESALKSANLSLKEKEHHLKENKETFEYMLKAKIDAQKKEQMTLNKYQELQKEKLKLEEDFNEIILNPELTEKYRELLIEETEIQKKLHQEKQILLSEEEENKQNKKRGFSR